MTRDAYSEIISRPNKLPSSRIPIACQNPRLLSTAPNPLSPNDRNRNHVLNGDGTSPSSKPQTAKPYQPLTPSTQPSFRLSGPYSGEDGIPASRWLKKLQYDLKPYYQSGLQHMHRSLSMQLTLSSQEKPRNGPRITP